MTGEAWPDPRWGDSGDITQRDHSLTPPPRRWLLVIAVVVCAGLGAGLAGRLWWRPGQTSPVQSRQRPQQKAAASAGRLSPPAVLLPATPEEFVTDAKRLADELMASFPESPQAFLLGGRIYYAFGDVARAKDCWQQCLRVNPEFAQGWCSRGEGAWEHGEFAEAAGYLQKAVEYGSRLDQKQVFLLADSLMNIGKAEEAVAVLEKAAEAGPLPLFGLFLLGNGYLELEEHEKAKQQFEAALAVDPHSASVHYGLVRAFAGLGQAEKAQKHREEYARLKSQELTQTARSRSELRKRDWADVRPLARECYLNAGKIYAVHGVVEEAERLWLRAAALDPENPRPRTLLESLYRQQGRHKEAVLISRGIASEGP